LPNNPIADFGPPFEKAGIDVDIRLLGFSTGLRNATRALDSNYRSVLTLIGFYTPW